MRYLSFCFGVIFLVHSFSVQADDASQSSYATSFGVGSNGGLSFKKVLNDTNQVFAGFSLGQGDSQSQTSSFGYTTSSDSRSDFYTIFAGVRHFLEKEKLSKFFQLSIAGTRSTSTSNYSSSYTSTTTNTMSATLGYGVEYFITPNFSIEGVAGLSYSYSNASVDASGVAFSASAKSVAFPVVGTAITYYW